MTVTEALAALHTAGRLRSAWLPGMAYLSAGGAVTRGRPWADDEPVLTDPATVGCLLALLREAERDPGVTVRSPEPGDTPQHWYVHLQIENAWANDIGAPTEGQAIADALIARAEGRAP